MLLGVWWSKVIADDASFSPIWYAEASIEDVALTYPCCIQKSVGEMHVDSLDLLINKLGNQMAWREASADPPASLRSFNWK